MNRVKYVILTMVSNNLLSVASASSTFACAFWRYQPETPKSLIK